MAQTTFTFKLVYTCIIHQYQFDPQLTMREFIESATQQFARDAQLDYPIEVVEAGYGETAIALTSSNISLYEHVNGRNVAFYIRRIIEVEACIVCNIPNATRVRYYDCSHANLCMDCHARCLRANNRTCPICRSI